MIFTLQADAPKADFFAYEDSFAVGNTSEVVKPSTTSTVRDDEPKRPKGLALKVRSDETATVRDWS